MLRKCNEAVKISRWAFVYFAALLLAVPLPLLLAAVICAAVHELCHLGALWAMKVPVLSISVGPHGARIKTPPMEHWQELLCALAGPAGGILLLCLYRCFPLLSLCAAVQTAYNLLPVYPADGGRVLRCIAFMLLPESVAEKTVRVAGILCTAGIVILGVWGTARLRLGVLPLAAALAVAFRNSACKPSPYRVQ